MHQPTYHPPNHRSESQQRLRRVIATAANVLLFGYVLDATLTVLDTLLGATGNSAIHGARQLVAYTVMALAGLWLFAFVLLGDLLRKWLLFWLALSVFWLNGGGQPVGLFFEDVFDPRYQHSLVALQVGIASLTLILVRRRYGHWWVTTAVPVRIDSKFFAWLGRFLSRAFVIGLLWLSYQPLGVMSMLEQSTGGYLSFTWDGVLTREVEFEDPETGTVRLIGMMHFGEPLAYQALLESFEAPNSIILEEGITDRSGLLPELSPTPRRRHFTGGIRIQPTMEEVRGVQRIEHAQERHGWVNLKNADVDAAELNPETLEWTRQFVELRERSTREEFPLLFILTELGATLPEGVFNEILFTRNDRLMAELETVRGEFNQIIVPWGALHMPGIEHALKEIGYTPTERERRWTLLHWKTLADLVNRSRTRQERTLSRDALEAYAERSRQAMFLTRKPALELLPLAETDPESDGNPIGFSGGLPTRYEGEQWPRNGETGMPLGFLLEITRDEAHADFFGEVNRLRLFVDYSEFLGDNEESAYAVLIDRVGDPERTVVNWSEEELAALAAEFGPAQRDYNAELTWPYTALDLRPTVLVDRELMPSRPYGVDRPTMLEWFDISDRVQAAFAAANPGFRLENDGSFLGGHPQWIQGEQGRIELPFFLQFYPPDDMNWADAGIFYLFLDKENPNEVVLLGQSS